MMVRASLIFAVTISVLSICLPFGSAKSFAQTEYTGKLHRELIPEVSGFAVRHLTPASEATLKKLKLSLPSPDRALAGSILHPRTKEDIPVVLLESASATTLCADVDQDGTLPASECLPLTDAKNLTGPNVYAGEVRVELPMSMKYFQNFPVVLRLFNTEKDPEIKKGNRTLLYTYNVYVKGSANIAGSERLVKYSLDLKTGLIDPLNGQLGFDVNGDGEIDMANFSPEWTGAKNETVIFRVGQHYVSTKSVNTETGEISLRPHDAKEYQRIDVQVGAEIPDFAFLDFDGASRKLSDFKGKYVLLDFWGSWCTPCKAEMPYLKAAYARFKSRGFEILGMDKDEDPAKAKLFVTENQMAWPQATTESIQDLIRFRFRISGWPSKILIDPQQRVVMLDAKGQLNGDKLAEALDKLLPKNAQAETQQVTVERKIVDVPAGSIQPTAGFSVSYSFESRLGLSDGPVRISPNPNYIKDPLSMAKVLVENASSREVETLKLQWYLFDDKSSKQYLKHGETKEIKVGRLSAKSSKVVASGIPSFEDMFKSLTTDGLISGSYYVELIVTDVVFADGTKWKTTGLLAK